MRQSSVREERGRSAVPEPREDGEDDGPPGGKEPASGDAGYRPSGPRRPKRSRGVRILRWSALTLTVLILGAAGAGYFYYQHLNGNLRKEELDLGDSKIGKPEPNAAGQTPLNILLIGSDSRNTAENVKLGGAKQDADRKPLADVQMLVHVSADRANMSVVSIPRDTRVTIPRCTDPKDGTVYPK
ncbi:LCP family glycopolymer transferase, partial [Streptomyces milbemycinicus]